MTRSNASLVACCVLTWVSIGCESESTSAPQVPTAASPAAGAGAASPSAPAAPSGTPAPQSANTPTPTAAVPSSLPSGSAPSTPAGTQPSAPAPAAGAAPSVPATTGPVDPATLDHTKDIRGHCSINTGYPDDHACLVAPNPEEGFQVHFGPKNYADANEVAKFIMKPGEESSECFTVRSDNPAEIVYQSWVLSGRAGTHHIISNTYSGELPENEWGNCGGRESAQQGDANAPAQTGSVPGASKAYMPRNPVAPEYADVGYKLPAKTLIQSDMHYFNFTDKDIIREYWINFYYAPEGKVTRYADILVGFGGTSWNDQPIPVGMDMVYKYECPFTGNGYLMNLLGHYHAHGKRFTGSIKRASGAIEKVFEMYDYLDPAVYDYNSVAQNPPFGVNTSGAVSGQIAIMDGDVLQWECHIINDSDAALTYTNAVKTGEMCNIWGWTVDTDPLRCFLQ